MKTFNLAQQFLNRELARIERELSRIAAGSNAFSWDGSPDPEIVSLYHEYNRRGEIVNDLTAQAQTVDHALQALQQKQVEAEALIENLIGVVDEDDSQLHNALIDVDYITGLHIRLQRALTDGRVRYALIGIDNL